MRAQSLVREMLDVACRELRWFRLDVGFSVRAPTCLGDYSKCLNNQFESEDDPENVPNSCLGTVLAYLFFEGRAK